MLGTKLKIVTKPQVDYFEALAFSLWLYAQRHKGFSAFLERLTTRFAAKTDIHAELYDVPERIEILEPRDKALAERRAGWLFERIVHSKMPGAYRAAHILSSPKQIIIGITPGAIPGVTLGRISRSETLTVFIRDDLFPEVGLELSEQISRAVTTLLWKSFDAASGKLSQLEPELADWFSSDRSLDFVQASEQQLAAIDTELQALGVTSAAVRTDKRTSVLAISPAVNMAYLL